MKNWRHFVQISFDCDLQFAKLWFYAAVLNWIQEVLFQTVGKVSSIGDVICLSEVERDNSLQSAKKRSDQKWAARKGNRVEVPHHSTSSSCWVAGRPLVGEGGKLRGCKIYCGLIDLLSGRVKCTQTLQGDHQTRVFGLQIQLFDNISLPICQLLFLYQFAKLGLHGTTLSILSSLALLLQSLILAEVIWQHTEISHLGI